MRIVLEKSIQRSFHAVCRRTRRIHVLIQDGRAAKRRLKIVLDLIGIATETLANRVIEAIDEVLDLQFLILRRRYSMRHRRNRWALYWFAESCKRTIAPQRGVEIVANDPGAIRKCRMRITERSIAT